MSLSGRVFIRANISGNRLRDIEVNSIRPAMAQKLVEGKSPDDAANIISQCYIVCKQAQSAVATMAATLQKPDENQFTRIQLESIDQTMWRWMVDLPRLLDLPLLLPDYAKIKRQIFHWMMDSCGATNNQGDTQTLHLSVTNTWFENLTQLSTENWLNMDTAAMNRWLADESPAAAIVNQAMVLLPKGTDVNLPSLHSGYFNQLDESVRQTWVADTIEKIMALNADEHQWLDQVSRNWSEPVNRLMIRLYQLAKNIHQLVSGGFQVDHGYRKEGEQILSWVMTARGWLLHKITLTESETESSQHRISSYQILSPTDCYFGNDGITQTLLRHLDISVSTNTDKAIELIILAMDPCVEYDVEVKRARNVTR